MISDPNEVLDFWRELGPKKWFSKDHAVDVEITSRFEESVEKAGSGGYDHWVSDPDGALALIIMLDQFPRNMYRNNAKAFSHDQKCVGVTHDAISAGLDQKMPEDLRPFCYMPLMHSEDLENQEKCIEMMEKTGKEDNVKHAIIHRDIIRDFGRFPHRNVVFDRDTTPEEARFLEDGGFAG